MAAFFEKHQLRAWYGVRHAPRGQRRDIHVVAAGDDQGRKVKSRQLGSEIEILGGLRNGAAHRGHKAEISHVREIGIAQSVE